MMESRMESVRSSRSDLETLELIGDEDTPREKISTMQAAWNITSAIQGVITLSLPYLVLHGGLWGLIIIAATGVMACYTGKVLIECMYETTRGSEPVRMYHTFVELAQRCWGPRVGSAIVNFIQITEQVLTCSSHILLCGHLLTRSFPETPLSETVLCVICSVLLIPCIFLNRLSVVSIVSFWSSVALLPIALTILGYCLTRVNSWQWQQLSFKADLMFPATFGVLAINYTSQIFLPMLEKSMVDRKSFNKMINWTHYSAVLVKLVFATITVLAWGDNTRQVITNNLPNPNVKVIINIIIVVKVLLTYPLYYYSAVELLEDTFFQGWPRSRFPTCVSDTGRLRIWALGLRFLLLIATLIMAIGIPYYTLLLGVVGSFTGATVMLVFPCMFHLQLKWEVLTWRDKLYDAIIMASGVFMACLGVSGSAYELTSIMHGYGIIL